MKLASWNVNSIRARQQRVLTWLEEHQPDVVCLQETKVPDEQFPVAELQALGYGAAIHGQRGYNGVAILARQPLHDVRIGFGDGGDDTQSRLIAATVDGVRVMCVYVPNGQSLGSDKFAYKLEWLARLRRYLESTSEPSAPLVLCGDFNVAPDDRDCYDPVGWAGKIHCSDEERQALAQLVEWGLCDTLRKHHDQAGMYSWWDYRMLAFAKGRGLRIDMIYVTEPLAARCTEAAIDRQARKGKLPSDHAPILATFA